MNKVFLNPFVEVRPLTEVAESILKKRYYADGENSWSQVVDRVISWVIGKADFETKELTRSMILNRYFIPNSPCLVNSGKPGGGLVACFVVDFQDSIVDIYKTKLDFALIAKKGGGCGTTLSFIRPENSKVNGSVHGYAGGPIKFFDTICHDMKAMTQSGFREMAMMGTMSVYHPDIIKFIKSKETEGVMHTTNISVVVDDKFMQAVLDDGEFTTEFNGVKYDTYKARDVFNLIVEQAWKNGEPGLLFFDRINDSPYKYAGITIHATNPCLDKDTILLDGDRLTKISSGGKTFSSWKTGEKDVIRLTTNAGYQIILTPDHKVMLPDGTFEEARNLLGKEIAWITGDRESRTLNMLYVLYGFLFGDGFLSGKKKGVAVKINPEKEPEVAKLLEEFGFNREESGSFYINRKRIPFDTAFLENRVFDRNIPDEILFGNSDVCRSFLVGLFEANGSVTSSGQISLKSTNRDMLSKVQILLSSFGVKSWIVENKPTTIQWKNGTYTSRSSYNLQIAPRNGYKFKQKIGFLSDRKNSRIKEPNLEYNGNLVVVSIESLGTREVWDFNNEKHWEISNGVSVHNCGEQPLPFNGSCNLGSIDISKFLNEDKTINLELLELAVRLSVRFLDSVIDVNSFPTEDIQKEAYKNRPIGLGIMGLADYYLERGIEYGSEKSIEELNFILGFMYQIAEDESIRLGEELGVPENCQYLPVKRRNITLLSIAPTGTISLLAGCNSGIEPFFSEITLRNDKTGTYIFEKENLPEHFKCAVSANGAKEVTWKEHIDIQAASQRHVDSGVSKTINFPNHTKKETVGKAFIYAWQSGCKGITIYRNGSRQVEVLSPKKLKKDECPVCGSEMINESGCSKCSNVECGFSVCTVS